MNLEQCIIKENLEKAGSETKEDVLKIENHPLQDCLECDGYKGCKIYQSLQYIEEKENTIKSN